MTDYKLRTVATGNTFEDSGWLLSDPTSTTPSLIRAIYGKKELEVAEERLGIYRFADWLPINRLLNNASQPRTYKSKKLAANLGLSNLYITFSGYWPKIGANMTTCSFKETEAYTVCARMKGDEKGVMVVASAGNTARAFAKVCSDNDIPLLLVVPYENRDAIWFGQKIRDNVKLISTPPGSDYYDSIHLANKICQSDFFFEEGGAKNVARRDGMGTTVLSAVTTIEAIPDYYFQAIGSATGTISAWEANLRFIEDGRYGDKMMRLFPAQNSPFTPIADAWQKGSRDLEMGSEDEARQKALSIDAKVLANRKPPYAIVGGLFDALTDSDGDVERVTNRELREASALFERLEGVDIHPASAVALSGMMKSIEKHKISSDSVIMLNITGGGENLYRESNPIYFKQPDLIMDHSLPIEETISRAESLFK